jgi:uroporphyrin-III C-methyltransferase
MRKAMLIRYYGANATLSTISTTSYSQYSSTYSYNGAKQEMKEKEEQSSINLQKKITEEKMNVSPLSKSSSNKTPISKLSLVAIALTLGLGSFVFYHGHQHIENQKRTIAALQNEITNLKQSTKQSVLKDLQTTITETLNQQNQQFSSLEQRVVNQLAEQQKLQHQITNQVTDSTKLNEQALHSLNERLSAMSSTDQNTWLISQANYLVNLAGRKIWNDQDYTTARLLLKNADKSLAQTNDPSLIPARQAINKDINSLSEISLIDSDGIIMNLIGLSDALIELPLVGNYKEVDLGMNQYNDEISEDNTSTRTNHSSDKFITNRSNNKSSEVTTSLSDWSDNLLSNADTFMKKFITIEKIDKDDNKFSTCISLAGKDEKQIVRCQILQKPLTLEQSLYLRENIRFRLLIAAQAVPRHQELIYQRALNDASIWVNAYFDGHAPSVKAFLHDLDNLQNQSISNQKVPEKLISQSELEKLMQTRVRAMLAK